MNDRDCDNCEHHSEGGCSVWECSFTQKEDDTISRQAALKICRKYWHPTFNPIMEEIEQLPSAQPTQTDTSNTLKALDCVERQAAIDAANDWLLDCLKIQKQDRSCGLIRRLEDLPSAQPEIVRCRECKYCEHWYADRGRCFLWHEDGISVFEDGFCNYAERRTNGVDH